MSKHVIALLECTRLSEQRP